MHPRVSSVTALSWSAETTPKYAVKSIEGNAARAAQASGFSRLSSQFVLGQVQDGVAGLQRGYLPNRVASGTPPPSRSCMSAGGVSSNGPHAIMYRTLSDCSPLASGARDGHDRLIASRGLIVVRVAPASPARSTSNSWSVIRMASIGCGHRVCGSVASTSYFTESGRAFLHHN